MLKAKKCTLGFFHKLAPHGSRSCGFSCHKALTGPPHQLSPGPSIGTSLQRTSIHVKIALMLIAVLINIWNAFSPVISFDSASLWKTRFEWNEVEYHVNKSLTPTSLPVTCTADPRNYSLPFESMLEICGMPPPHWLARPWVGARTGCVGLRRQPKQWAQSLQIVGE